MAYSGLVPAYPDRPHLWRWFLVWVLAGALVSVSVAATFTPFILALPVVIAGVVLLAIWHRSRWGFPGVISGLGVPLLVVAYLNRDAGTHCNYSSSIRVCATNSFDPLPWLVLGLFLLLGGVAVMATVTTLRAGRPTGRRAA